MTGRDLNAWLATGDGREPTPAPPPAAAPRAPQSRAPQARPDDAARARGFLRRVVARQQGEGRPCA